MKTKQPISRSTLIRYSIVGILRWSLLVLALCLAPCALRPALAQVPQGFNYQAIARDGLGNPITGATIKVRLSVLTDTVGFRAGTGGTYLWEEEHTGVITNAYGLFNIVLGDPTATWVRGVLTFEAINWNQPKLYIGTKIANPSIYKVLGGAKLWSVPYSLIAGELAGTVDKIKVKGTEVEPDSALFEVKNKNGQTVFVVYNEGVRIYVDDGVAKGITKGGFAIGGFGTDKGASQNYFTVSRDSIRAYVNDTISKGITKGGFAIGGFGTAKAPKQEYFRVTRDSTRIYVNDLPGGKGITKGGFAIGGFDVGKTGLAPTFFDVFPDSSGKVFPARNKILWYPLKNALLAGRVIAENRDSVGENSFASGYESRSKGNYSQALGYKAIARGDFSTAIGKNAVAGKINSFAFGDASKSLGVDSYAFGAGAIAKGIGSYAFGSAGRDTLGNLSGTMTTASGDYSFAIGQGAEALDDLSLAMGFNTKATTRGATALGAYTTASNYYSIALGYYSLASGYRSITMGSNTTSSGDFSASMGSRSIASGSTATAMGLGTQAIGDISTSMGRDTKATSFLSLVIGRNNDTTSISSTSWDPSDPLFICGNGATNKSRKNAFTVYKNGNTYIQGRLGIGATSPLRNLDIITNNSSTEDMIIHLGEHNNEGGYLGSFAPSDLLLSGGVDYSYGWIARDVSASTLRLLNGYTYFSNNTGLIVNNSFNPTVRMIITPQGNVGIGADSPTARLDILGGSYDVVNTEGDLRIGNGSYRFKIGVATGGTGAGDIRLNAVGGSNRLILGGAGNDILVVNNTNVAPYTNNVTSFGNSTYRWTTIYATNGTISTSDERLKTNIADINYGLESILKMRPVSFTWKTDSENRPKLGLIAQELQNIICEVVDKGDDPSRTLGINYSELVPVLIKGIQEQQQQIESQQKEIDELKSLVNSLINNKIAQTNK